MTLLTDRARRAVSTASLSLIVALPGCTVEPLSTALPSGTPGSSAASPSALPSASAPLASPTAPTPSASVDTGPSPVASATVYIVQPGDSLIAIASRFGVTVSQILAANPDIDDADDILAGDPITIPTQDAPSGLPRADGISDARGDLLDLQDQPTFATGAVDLTGLGARLDADTVFIELLVVAPPPSASPDVEQISYTVNIDTNDDGEPDFRLVASNTLESDLDYAATLIVLATEVASPAGSFPGSFEIDGAALRFDVLRASLGDPRRYAMAATAERRFFPGGANDPEVEAALDRAPDQQWPRANARWLEIGR